MLASILVAAALAASLSPPPEKPTMAVVITGHEGLAFDEALELARKLTRALGATGAPQPMDPQATVTMLGGKNPEACGTRSACLADLAHALHVSALVTMDGGKVVGDIALAVSLVDGRDGRKLLERTSAAPPAQLDAALMPLAAELDRRLTISLVAGIGSAVLTGAAAFFLLQPPAR